MASEDLWKPLREEAVRRLQLVDAGKEMEKLFALAALLIGDKPANNLTSLRVPLEKPSSSKKVRISNAKIAAALYLMDSQLFTNGDSLMQNGIKNETDRQLDNNSGYFNFKQASFLANYRRPEVLEEIEKLKKQTREACGIFIVAMTTFVLHGERHLNLMEYFNLDPNIYSLCTDAQVYVNITALVDRLTGNEFNN
jgi:hypothetical protein